MDFLKLLFPEPPLLAHKRQKNIRDHVIRAKVQSSNRNTKRKLKGMKTCGKQCPICPFVKEGNFIKSNNFIWRMRDQYNCEDSNIIYMIECNKDQCNQRYIGEGKRKLKHRLAEHIGYIKSNIDSQPTGWHFNLPGHSLHNLTVTVIEKEKKLDTLYRKERESYLIKKFDTYRNGMNRQP